MLLGCRCAKLHELGSTNTLNQSCVPIRESGTTRALKKTLGRAKIDALSVLHCAISYPYNRM